MYKLDLQTCSQNGTCLYSGDLLYSLLIQHSPAVRSAHFGYRLCLDLSLSLPQSHIHAVHGPSHYFWTYVTKPHLSRLWEEDPSSGFQLGGRCLDPSVCPEPGLGSEPLAGWEPGGLGELGLKRASASCWCGVGQLGSLLPLPRGHCSSDRPSDELLFAHLLWLSPLTSCLPFGFIFLLECKIEQFYSGGVHLSVSYPFCLFLLSVGFSRQEYWSDLPFPSPVDHVLSDLSWQKK